MLLRRAEEPTSKNIEYIYFFEVNTKYISSNVLKISVISRVRSTSEIAGIFNTFDEIFLTFRVKEGIFGTLRANYLQVEHSLFKSFIGRSVLENSAPCCSFRPFYIFS